MSGSTQVVQVPQVIGHAADTPPKAQRFLVSFSATHVQYLEMVFPFLMIFNLNGESLHATVGAKVVTVAVGDAVGGKVGLKGAADGEGDGDGSGVGADTGCC